MSSKADHDAEKTKSEVLHSESVSDPSITEPITGGD